jgi:SAM-dependent methyltransferase
MESAARFGGFDWRRTPAFSEEANTQPGVWLNLAGREASGCVAPSERERVLREVIDSLLDWKLPDGAKVVARARRREEVYAGPFVERAPDVVVELALDAGHGLSLVPTPWRSGLLSSVRTLDDASLAGGRGRGLNGTHRPEGVLLAVGPGREALHGVRTLSNSRRRLRAAMPWADGRTDAGLPYTAEEEAEVATRHRRWAISVGPSGSSYGCLARATPAGGDQLRERLAQDAPGAVYETERASGFLVRAGSAYSWADSRDRRAAHDSHPRCRRRRVDLVDRLGAGYSDITVLDIAAPALEHARARLGDAAARVTWIEADITRFRPAREFALWHDRAVFHFLTDAGDRDRYLGVLRSALRSGGHVVLATFGPEGPMRCSGLAVQRYSAQEITALLGPGFALRMHRLGALHSDGNGAAVPPWLVGRDMTSVGGRTGAAPGTREVRGPRQPFRGWRSMPRLRNRRARGPVPLPQGPGLRRGAGACSLPAGATSRCLLWPNAADADAGRLSTLQRGWR